LADAASDEAVRLTVCKVRCRGTRPIRLAGQRDLHRRALPLLLTSLSTLCLASTAILWRADAIHRQLGRALGGGGMAGAIAAEMLLAAAVFLLPTMAMGATFGHLAEGQGRARWGSAAPCASTRWERPLPRSPSVCWRCPSPVRRSRSRSAPSATSSSSR
jgi:hypothetical protein